jgi:hypothetical protein
MCNSLQAPIVNPLAHLFATDGKMIGLAPP